MYRLRIIPTAARELERDEKIWSAFHEIAQALRRRLKKFESEAA